MNPILGAQMLMIKPDDAITAPAKTTIRNPSLLQRTLEIGPEHVFKKNYRWLRLLCMTVINLEVIFHQLYTVHGYLNGH